MSQEKKSTVPMQKPLWSVPLGPTASYGERDVRSVSINGMIYYIAFGKLTAANLRTGKVKWQVGKDLDAPLIVKGSSVLAATRQSGKLYAFDLATGKVRWLYNTGQALGNPELRVVQHLSSDSLRVYLVSRGAMSQSRVTTLDFRTGKLIWSQKHDFFTDEVKIDGQLLIIGAVESGSISMRKYYAFDKVSGKQQWKLDGSHESIVAIRDGKMYVPAGFPFAMSDQYELQLDVIDVKTGKSLAKQEYIPLKPGTDPLIASTQKMMVDGDDLYVQSSRGIVHRLDLLDDRNKTGTIIADLSRHQMQWLAGPYADRLMFWSDVHQRLIATKTANLQMLTLIGPRIPISQLQMMNSGLFVGQMDGELFAINLVTSNPVFRYPTGGRSFAPFQLSGRTLIAETENRLLAFDLPATLVSPPPVRNIATSLKESNVKVKYNEQMLALKNPVLGNMAQMYVPLEELLPSTGYSMTVNESLPPSYGLRIGKDHTASWFVDHRLANVNGKQVVLSKPPLLIKQKLYVEYKDAAKLLGMNVSWDNGKRIINYK
jgi:outer membrane protein assembly factor BamB